MWQTPCTLAHITLSTRSSEMEQHRLAMPCRIDVVVSHVLQLAKEIRCAGAVVGSGRGKILSEGRDHRTFVIARWAVAEVGAYLNAASYCVANHGDHILGTVVQASKDASPGLVDLQSRKEPLRLEVA